MAKRARKPDPPGSPGIFLRIPDSLNVQLKQASRESKCTVQAVILSVLAARFSVDVDPPKRGGKKKG